VQPAWDITLYGACRRAARERHMLIGTRVTIGPIFPEDFGLLFCWANDVAAARLDLAYRPVDLISHRQWCESIGQDPTRIIFAIRRLQETAIIGYVKS
jgi:hypothetical protein